MSFDNVKFLYGYAVVSSGYQAWADGFGLAGDEGDDDDGDFADNLYEYAVGGDPTNSADVGFLPSFSIVQDGGTNWGEYVHVQRKAAVGELTYGLELTPDLADALSWTNGGYIVTGTNTAFDLEFEAVTNRTPATADVKTIRLTIEAQ